MKIRKMKGLLMKIVSAAKEDQNNAKNSSAKRWDFV